MTFTELTTKIDDLLGTNSSQFSTAKKARALNSAYDYAISIVRNQVNDSLWDDPNWNDLAIGYVNLVSGQAEYSVFKDTNNAHITDIHAVFRQDSTDDWTELKRTTIHENGLFADEDETGDPTCYMYMGGYIVLQDIPDTNTTNGLKFFFSRTQRRFTQYDDTIEPGFNPLFHDILAYHAAMEFAIEKGMQSAPSLKVLRDERIQELIKYENTKNTDKPRVLKAKKVSAI